MRKTIDFKKFKKQSVKATAVFFAVLMLFSVCFCASAASITETDSVPYVSYTYWQGYQPKKAFPTQMMYEVERVLDIDDFGGKSLDSAQHLICDPTGERLFVMDSGNGRIVIISLIDYSFIGEIGPLSHNGETLDFKGAKGIYIAENGMIYISDTENKRVLVLNEAAQVVNIITAPKSEQLPEGFDFRPTRVIVDRKGYTYILSQGCYYGALTFDKSLQFCGFFGANVVQTNILDAFSDLITSIFETDEKREASMQTLPSEFTDFCLSPDGFLYTISSNQQGELRKLGPKGSNNLNYQDGYKYSNADTFNFGDNEEDITRVGVHFRQSFAGITVDEQGFIYMLDSLRCRIYMYDSDCRLISIFGTGFGVGEQVGTFKTPTAISSANGKLYILDFIKGNITVMKSTEYGKLVMKADSLVLEGAYEEARPYFEKVLASDKNSQIAYSGLAKAAYINGEYEKAMEYAKSGLDQATYAQAFEVVSNEFLKENFIWIAAICLLIIGGAVFFVLYTKKREVVLIKNKKLNTALSVATHPFVSFNSIKAKNNGSVLIASVIILIYFILNVCETLYGGFMYVGIERENLNIFFKFLGSVGVLALWIICNWGVCILMEGKGKLKEIFCVSAYCMLIQIISSVLFIFLSHIVVASSFSPLAVIATILDIYTIIILLIGMSVIHEFSFFRSLFTAFITLLGMLLMAFLIFVFFMLIQDFAGFIIGVVREVLFR